MHTTPQLKPSGRYFFHALRMRQLDQAGQPALVAAADRLASALLQPVRVPVRAATEVVRRVARPQRPSPQAGTGALMSRGANKAAIPARPGGTGERRPPVCASPPQRQRQRRRPRTTRPCAGLHATYSGCRRPTHSAGKRPVQPARPRIQGHLRGPGCPSRGPRTDHSAALSANSLGGSSETRVSFCRLRWGMMLAAPRPARP